MMEFIPFGSEDKIKLSVSIIKNLVCTKTKSGKVCTDTDAIRFMMLCQARRLNPFEGDCFLIGYDGKDGPTFSLITAHQAFLKRAEVNKEYDGLKSGVIIERDGQMQDLEGDFYLPGDKVLGGWSTVFFKNRKQPMHKRIRMERFRKSFGIWIDDAAGMIVKCAEADALRSSFPTMLGGLYLKEEVEHAKPIEASTPIFTTVESKEVPTKVEAGPAMGHPVEEVRKLCKDSGIEEETLLQYMIEIGIADNNRTTLEQVHEANDSTLPMVIAQWDDFLRRIKEASKNEK